LIRQARQVNDARPQRVVDRVDSVAAQRATVACLGLAFKPDVDDMRESPAVTVVQRLAETRSDLRLLAVEPYAEKLPAALAAYDNVVLSDLDEALDHSDVVLLLVHHAAFVHLDPPLLEDKQVVDTRGIWRGSRTA
jgi:UDP-N-acetyl-D-mannosaminuronic acid dehydrogenase